MTASEFNTKYSKYLKQGFYGMSVTTTDFINYVNKVFELLIKDHPRFEYYQIKVKFGNIRFYSNLDMDFGMQLEQDFNRYYQSLIIGNG